MNNSFEQFFKKTNNKKHCNRKNVPSTTNSIKKQPKHNFYQKNKNSSLHNQLKNQHQSYNKSVISNQSSQKNYLTQNSKSNHKRIKRQENNNSRNKQGTIKKQVMIQLTKKQIQIRQAIQYRFDKSKMRNYQINYNGYQTQQIKLRQIMDLQEQQSYQQKFYYLKQLKVVNLYDYHRYKHQIYQPNQQIQFKKDKHPNILVIKDTKKRRQNSDTIISYTDKQTQNLAANNNSNRKLVLNSFNNFSNNLNLNPLSRNNPNYFSSNNHFNVLSQRNYTQSSSYQNKKQQIQSPANYFKLQLPKSNVNKQKSGSRNKSKNDCNLSLNQKINLTSSSVQKNFKSIKDIYLNAISSLANKNTLKSKNKLFKSDNQLKNKASNSVLYQSQKKSFKNQYNSSRPQKNYHNSSSSALYQNYFSCISSRQNKKQNKTNSNHQNRKPTKQKLDKTLLINEANPSQWKSIIMKLGNPNKFQNTDLDVQNDSKKIKFKQKEQIPSQKLNKNALEIVQSKYIGNHPHSQRQYTKSPKFKRYVIDQQIQSKKILNRQDKKQMNSAKNLYYQTYQTIKNTSQLSSFRDSSFPYNRNKK